MADFTIDPLMGLPIPTVGVDPGPDWANNLNQCLALIAAHNHEPGSGVLITPGALDINTDLTLQGFSLTHINTLVLAGAVVGTPSVLSIYTNGTDLFYKDVNGNAIQLTLAGGPNAGTGNISGLPSTPSGGAGIAWVNATSTFQFLTDAGVAGANLDSGSLIIRYPGSYPSPSGNAIVLKAPAAISGVVPFTFPATLPGGAPQLMQLSSGGIISFSNSITGNVAVSGALTASGGSPVALCDSAASLTFTRGTVEITGSAITILYGDGFTVSKLGTGSYEIATGLSQASVTLGWSQCWSSGTEDWTTVITPNLVRNGSSFQFTLNRAQGTLVDPFGSSVMRISFIAVA